MCAVFVINADDLGISRGSTLGVVEAHLKGIVTSASLTATTPGYDFALKECCERCPRLGIGLHFTLTAGKPVSPPSRVPDLIDHSGFFRWRFFSLLRELTVGRNPDLLEQIEVELHSQLEKLSVDGVVPDHINGERHVHLLPGILERVVAVALDRNIPFVRMGVDTSWKYLRWRHAVHVWRNAGPLKSLLLNTLARRSRSRLAGTTRSCHCLASYLFSGRMDLILREVLTDPRATGVTEIMVHPGIPGESRGVRLGNSELEGYLIDPARHLELQACLSALDVAGCHDLVTFRDLAKMEAFS